jgi:DNA-binding beta-propeller fold protein YncE
MLILCLLAARAEAQLVISGNEGKIDLTPGVPTVVADPEPDTLSFLDFRTFPPKVTHLENVKNSVIGPPSNIAISPDGRMALVASSILVAPQDKTKTIPDTVVHILDLVGREPKVVGQVEAGKQPSGISFSPNGQWAYVANRAEGTVTVLSIRGRSVKTAQTVEVALPADEVSDVAVSPDGKRALVSVTQAGYLAVLDLGDTVTLSKRKLGVFGRPYRVVITPDGALGLTAGTAKGEAPDTDCLSVIDLQANPIRSVDHIPVGPGPESFEVSPDGKLVAVVLMNGSNLPEGAPNRTSHGLLTLLARREKTYVKVQEVPIPRIPEGVAFTGDGKYLLVQGHPDRVIHILEVKDESVKDTGQAVSVPGMPSSLRASQR